VGGDCSYPRGQRQYVVAGRLARTLTLWDNRLLQFGGRTNGSGGGGTVVKVQWTRIIAMQAIRERCQSLSEQQKFYIHHHFVWQIGTVYNCPERDASSLMGARDYTVHDELLFRTIFTTFKFNLLTLTLTRIVTTLKYCTNQLPVAAPGLSDWGGHL